jgi:hypothetical protein
VIRFPNDYFGKLAITGAPAFRRQDANDFIMGDYALDKGYPFGLSLRRRAGRIPVAGGALGRRCASSTPTVPPSRKRMTYTGDRRVEG